MAFTVVIVSAVLIILLILPHLVKRVVYKKLTSYLSKGEYERFEKLLDGFACTFSFKPFNREYMRLTACFMQNDNKKIETQLDNIFARLKMREPQKVSVAQRGFYFYLENKQYENARKMLDICDHNDVKELHTMQMMYDIMAEHKSTYIQEIKERLQTSKKSCQENESNAEIVRMGILEYLLGLQYASQNNSKQSRSYLQSALGHCKNTPYEREILAILKQ